MKKIFCICLVCSALISAKEIDTVSTHENKTVNHKKESFTTSNTQDVLLEAENLTF